VAVCFKVQFCFPVTDGIVVSNFAEGMDIAFFYVLRVVYVVTSAKS
jgi:hypothetical protein